MVKGGRSLNLRRKKVREMRDAEHILGIIRERGKRGLPLEDIYRQLYNPTLYLMAYARLYSNEGAMTRGINQRNRRCHVTQENRAAH